LAREPLDPPQPGALAQTLILPEPIKAIRRQRSVPRCGLKVAMPRRAKKGAFTMASSDDYVRFDQYENALLSLELIAHFAPLVRKKPQYWKWIMVGCPRCSARCDGLRLLG
jgi:hypothetical protein